MITIQSLGLDDAKAIIEAGKAHAKRIGVPVDTVRNWEQGKRAPQGPARALLRIIDRAPEVALSALDPDAGRGRPGHTRSP